MTPHETVWMIQRRESIRTVICTVSVLLKHARKVKAERGKASEFSSPELLGTRSESR